MNEQPQQTEHRTCRFPGCKRPAVDSEAGTGRPPEYCDDATHTRGAAWRARQRLAQPTGQARVVDARPVDAARQRASEIRGQVGGMIEHLEQQLRALVDELRIAGDPDAAEAQIESVASDAAEQVAAANARASRAEQGQRRAEADRAEADAAAADATERGEQLGIELGQVRTQLAEANQARDQVAAELVEAHTTTETERQQSQAAIAQLRDEVTAGRDRLQEAEQERDAATARIQDAVAARAEAEQRARTAGERAAAEAARAARAEAETSAVREQLEAVRAQVDRSRDQVADLRGKVAGMTAERDAARADIERERAHGDQRVADLRTSYEGQLGQRQDELATVRDEARDQRSRADRAEAHLAARSAGSGEGGSPSSARRRRTTEES